MHIHDINTLLESENARRSPKQTLSQDNHDTTPCRSDSASAKDQSQLFGYVVYFSFCSQLTVLDPDRKIISTLQQAEWVLCLLNSSSGVYWSMPWSFKPRLLQRLCTQSCIKTRYLTFYKRRRNLLQFFPSPMVNISNDMCPDIYKQWPDIIPTLNKPPLTHTDINHTILANPL